MISRKLLKVEARPISEQVRTPILGIRVPILEPILRKRQRTFVSPTIISWTPNNGAKDVALESKIIVQFNKKMDPSWLGSTRSPWFEIKSITWNATYDIVTYDCVFARHTYYYFSIECTDTEGYTVKGNITFTTIAPITDHTIEGEGYRISEDKKAIILDIADATSVSIGASTITTNLWFKITPAYPIDIKITDYRLKGTDYQRIINEVTYSAVDSSYHFGPYGPYISVGGYGVGGVKGYLRFEFRQTSP